MKYMEFWKWMDSVGKVAAERYIAHSSKPAVGSYRYTGVKLVGETHTHVMLRVFMRRDMSEIWFDLALQPLDPDWRNKVEAGAKVTVMRESMAGLELEIGRQRDSLTKKALELAGMQSDINRLMEIVNA